MSAAKGKWDIVGYSGVVGVHAALLHTGQVLFYARGEDPSHKHNNLDNGLPGDAERTVADRDTLSTIVNIFGQEAYKPVKISIIHNPFCSGLSFLADGRLLLAGGDKKHYPREYPSENEDDRVPINTKDGRNSLQVLNPSPADSGNFQTIGRISSSRWYPTCTTLQDGRVFIISGYLDDMEPYNNQNPTCEMIPPLSDSPQYVPPLVEAWPYDGYPFVYLLPSGKLFLFVKDRAYFLLLEKNQSGKEIWVYENGSKLPPREVEDPAPNGDIEEPAKQYPNSSTSVLLPLLPENNYASEVLIIGGGGLNVHAHWGKVPGTNLLSYQIDARSTCFKMKVDPPESRTNWQRQRKMENPRVMPDAVLLPDGTVLVVNGVSKGFAGGYPATGPAIATDLQSGKENAVRAAELYDPINDVWQTLEKANYARLYHSTALLLPDAKVLVAGSDHQVNFKDNGGANTNNYRALGYEYRLEVFSPPYLFKDIPRPVVEIEGNQKPIEYGQQFKIKVRDLPAMEIESLRAVLMYPGAVTHGNNMSQRHVGLKILEKSETHLTLEAPPNSCIAPPGYYMLFLLYRGVPSEAQFVQILLEAPNKTSFAKIPRSNMALWLRADTGVVADARGAVTSWFDLSGSGNQVFLRDNGDNKPVPAPKWIQNELNGHPVLRFTLFANWEGGSIIYGACLETEKKSFLSGSSPYSVFVVIYPWPPSNILPEDEEGDRGWADLIGWGDFTQPNSNAYVGLRFGRGPSISLGEGGAIPKYPGTAVVLNYWNDEWQFGHQPNNEEDPRIPLSSAFLLEMFYDGSHTGMRMNGNEIKKDPASVEGRQTQNGPLTIGQNGQEGAFFRGDVAEILIYDRVITENERMEIQEYLRIRYALW